MLREPLRLDRGQEDSCQLSHQLQHCWMVSLVAPAREVDITVNTEGGGAAQSSMRAGNDMLVGVSGKLEFSCMASLALAACVHTGAMQVALI